MPMRTKELQREYQRQWIAKRRKDWFDANGPCVRCGSWERLELDHIDHTTKITHRIWSWAEERRLKELAKCQILCHFCHGQKSWNDQGRKRMSHPSHSSYCAGCRCQGCKAAHSAQERDRLKSF